MTYSNEKFSRMGFCGVLGAEKRFIWSTEPYLFRKIVCSRRFASSVSEAAKERSSFECRLTFDGVRFKITALPIPTERYLCMVYPEESYIKYAYSEMYMRIFNIKKNANRSVAALNEVNDELKRLDIPEELTDLISDDLGYSEEILSDSTVIVKLFDSAHMSEYVMIGESIRNSYEHVKKYNSASGKTVRFDCDISLPVARINYPVFESVLFEIVRILYKALPEKGSGTLKIKSSSDKKHLILSSVVPTPGFPEGKYPDHEIRDIACALECIGGSSRILLKDDKLVIRADVLAPLSNHVGRVKTDPLSDSGFVELKGYSRIISPVKEHWNGDLEFRSTAAVPKTPFSMLISDIMLGELVQA